MRTDPLLSIGQVARRTGLTVASLRFYEERELVQPLRTASGHRQFHRSDIRRLSFIRIAQKLGFTLGEIHGMLSTLPNGSAPTKADWTRLSRNIRADLDERIADLEAMRSRLDLCIGCGCLSLQACALYNPDDRAAKDGSGAKYLRGTPPRERDAP